MSLKDNLIAVWCESANPWTDQHTNALTLTDNNTVGTAAGKMGTAGDFEDTNSESLSRADEALLSTGDISWTEACWVKMESKSPNSNNYISSKATGGGGDVIERVLLYRNAASGFEDRFRIYIADFAVGVAANTFGSPSEGTWYYLQAQHDAAGDKLRIRVNDGAWDEVATGGVAPTDSAAAFYIGAYGNGGSPIVFWDGLINQFAFWKRLVTDEELDAIYNGGDGLAFSEWDAAGEQEISDAGDISAAEAFADPQLHLGLSGAGGIATAEAFGNATINPGSVTIADAGGIETLEGFGSPTLSEVSQQAIRGPALTTPRRLQGIFRPLPRPQALSGAGGIQSSEIVPAPSVLKGQAPAQRLSAVGIRTRPVTTFGVPRLRTFNRIVPESIAPAGALGLPQLKRRRNALERRIEEILLVAAA
jgi:hypothetical protein